jgi:hypothetical protein
MTQEPLVLLLTEVVHWQVVVLAYAFVRLVWHIHAHVHRKLPVRHHRLAHDALATRECNQRVLCKHQQLRANPQGQLARQQRTGNWFPAAVGRFAHRGTRKSDV